ncbi:MAG TPA: 50S ribosomal protein L9 [Verrucomicrobiae bacterium]|nr:50S ribosomal protein L9 [Verrucomicrobiae bacterium]
MSTQIILTANVEKLGGEGDTVMVADGYARNFLFPNGLAMPATAGNLRRVETLRKRREAAREAELTDAKDIAAKLVKQSFTITASAGPDEKLYGSVTAADIAEALRKEGIEVDRKKIVLEHSIRTTGVYDVDVKLHADVATKVKIWVVAGESAAPPAAKAGEEKTERPKRTSKKK